MIGATKGVTAWCRKKFCLRTLRQRDRPAAGPTPPLECCTATCRRRRRRRRSPWVMWATPNAVACRSHVRHAWVMWVMRPHVLVWVMWVMATRVQINPASCDPLAWGLGVGRRVGHVGVVAWVMRFQAWWVMWATPTRHTPYTVLTVAYTTIFD